MLEKNACSIYIHIPFCVSKCDYCDFFSIPIGSSKISDEYIDCLLEEIHARCCQFNISNFSTVYIGGGTPSLLMTSQLSKIMKCVLPRCSAGAEITIEMNPCDISENFLKEIFSIGINRISVGIQSLYQKSLEYVHRRSSALQNIEALEILSKFKKYNKNFQFSVDMISGLPFLTDLQFIDDMKNVISFKPDHISLYSLTIEEKTPLFNNILQSHKMTFSDIDDCSSKQWVLGSHFLQENGYNHYEVSNFALDNKESKHNLSYWKYLPYLGCGSGATGTIHGQQGNSIRYTNVQNISEYCKGVLDHKFNENQEVLDFNTRVFEYLMMGFRLYSGVDEKDFFYRFGLSLEDHIGKVFSTWEKRNYANKTAGKYFLNHDGMKFLNSFLEDIL